MDRLLEGLIRSKPDIERPVAASKNTTGTCRVDRGARSVQQRQQTGEDHLRSPAPAPVAAPRIPIKDTAALVETRAGGYVKPPFIQPQANPAQTKPSQANPNWNIPLHYGTGAAVSVTKHSFVVN